MARAGGDGGASFGIGRIVGYASGGYQAVDDDEEEMRGWGREPVGKGHDGWSRRRSGLGGFLGGLSDRIGEWVEQVDSGGLMREYVMETAGRAVTQCGPGTDRKMPPQILRMIVVLALLVLAMINVVGHAGATKRGMSKGRLRHSGETRKSSLMQPGLTLSAEGRCAEGSDKFDGKTGRCRLSNGVAYGALALQEWAKCDMGSPAVKLLQGMIDEEGRFWYPSAKAGLVRDFYSTCKAKCALSGDWYDTVAKACVVGNKEALSWLSTCIPRRDGGENGVHRTGCAVLRGRGIRCDTSGRGFGVVMASKIGVGWRHPDDVAVGGSDRGTHGFVYPGGSSRDVEEMYESCRHICARGDQVSSSDPGVCRVLSPEASRFLRGEGGGCDVRSRGYAALRQPKATERGRGVGGGRYWYRAEESGSVAAFYASCASRGVSRLSFPF